MAVTDVARRGRTPIRWGVLRATLENLPQQESLIPKLAVAAVILGLILVAVTTPIAARGDFGQWLMTSRYYLGESVPDYRSVSALPAGVPLLLAATQVVVRDPILALILVNALLMASLGVAFYLAGALILNNRWAGVFTVVLGLLVTDRFLELFAFGGMLQIASMASMCVAVAAYARVSRAASPGGRWWLVGTVATALAASTHVGTGVVAVPAGLAAATLATVALRRVGWRGHVKPIAQVVAALGLLATYWALVLLPANGDYLTNPASLAYRGPDRLFSAMFSYWPTTVLVVLGAAALVAGAIADALRRRIGGHTFLLVWIGATWGAFLYSMVTDAATDYPRFATLLLAPLVVASASTILWLLRAVSLSARDVGLGAAQRVVVPLALLGLLATAAPLAIDRHARQAAVYQPRDAAALTAAVTWTDEALGDTRSSVLTEVARDGKWLEGLTGRTALFSQPVRFAFRPVEWQRSVDANALLRSTGALTSGYVAAQYTSEAARSGEGVPMNLLISTNHGGEFVDVLSVPATSTVIGSGSNSASAASMEPVRAAYRTNADRASITTVWSRPQSAGATFTQALTTWRDGSAMAIVQRSPEQRITTNLLPAPGMAIISLTVTGRDAVACFTQVGDSEPCVRIHASQADARIKSTADGGVRVATRRSDRLDLLVTALTAGEASVGLSLLQPGQVADEYHIGAALLYEPDPAYAERARRLAAIGFTEVRAFGPYRVLLRDERSDSP